MKLKYLGKFEVSSELTQEIEQECDYCETVLYHEQDDSNWYDLGQFMVSSDSSFDAVAGESNSSSIVMQLDDSGESAKLWRAY